MSICWWVGRSGQLVVGWMVSRCGGSVRQGSYTSIVALVQAIIVLKEDEESEHLWENNGSVTSCPFSK